MACQIPTTLSGIDMSSFKGDGSARLAALHEARLLVKRLEKPSETISRLVWDDTFLLLGIKIAYEMGIFDFLGNTPKTSAQLASSTGTDVTLLRRITRLLGANQVVREVKVDTWVATEFSVALKDPHGVISGVLYHFDLVEEKCKLPAYLRSTGYRNPTDKEHPPFEQSSGLMFWDWLRAHADASSNFNSWISASRVGEVPWPSFYPVSRLLDGADMSKHSSLMLAVAQERTLSISPRPSQSRTQRRN